MGKIHFNSLPCCPRPRSHLDPLRIRSPIPLPGAKSSCEKILLYFMQDLGQEAMLSLQRAGIGSRARSHPVWSCREALGDSLMWTPHLSPPSPPDPCPSCCLERGAEQVAHEAQSCCHPWDPQQDSEREFHGQEGHPGIWDVEKASPEKGRWMRTHQAAPGKGPTCKP